MSEAILDAIHREMRNKKLLKDNSDSEKEGTVQEIVRFLIESYLKNQT